MLEKFLMISCNKHKYLALGQGERVVFLFSFYTIKGRSRGRSPQALSVPLELDHTVTLRAMLSPRRRRCGHALLPTLSWAFRAYWGNSKSLGAAFNELRKIFIILAMCNAQFYTSPPKETLQSTDPFFCKSMIVNTIFDTFLFCRQYFFSSLWTKGVLQWAPLSAKHCPSLASHLNRRGT